MHLWKELPVGRRVTLIAAVLVIVLLVVYARAAAAPGILYKDAFLKQVEADHWQGTVKGQPLTILRTRTEEGGSVLLQTPEAERLYSLAGDREHLILYTDGQEVFRGSYPGDYLMDENGELFMPFTVTFAVGGTEYAAPEDGGEPVPVSVLDVQPGWVVPLILSPWEDTRGEPVFAVFAAMFLLVLFVQIWWPEALFRWYVGRYVHGDAEPSDWYYTTRAFGMVALAVAAAVCLFMGFHVRL